MTDELTLTRPDDWHLHLRDGEMMKAVLPHSARRFGRAVVMPNLATPVSTTDQAIAYRDRILEAIPTELRFEPLMTLYLTDQTSPEEVLRARRSEVVHAVKYYPAGATTHSDSGVARLESTYPALETMAECGLPLLVHGEVTDPDVDVFDREARFVDTVLDPLTRRFPELAMVIEHVTTVEAVQFVESHSSKVAATVTPQHMLLNRNALFTGGLRPHHFCFPVLKSERHREAVVEAATGGNPAFFLGTDSAPHGRRSKESACGCAGVFTAHAALELYAEAFESVGRLDRLEAFSAHYGPDFYGLPRNNDRIRLKRESWTVPQSYDGVADEIVPFRAGGEIAWRLDPDPR